MSKLSEAIHQCTSTLLSEGRVSPSDVVRCVQMRHPDYVREEAERLVSAALRRQAKDALKASTEDDGYEDRTPSQLNLPGFKPPTAIAVRATDGEYEYVPFLEAELPDLEENVRIKRENEDRVVARRKDMEEKVGFLRPIMQGNDGMRVKEALAKPTRTAA